LRHRRQKGNRKPLSKKRRKKKTKPSTTFRQTGLVHLGSSNGFSTNSGSSRSVELFVVLLEFATATRGAVRLAPAPEAGVDSGRTSDIGRFGNRPSLLKSTPPGVPGVVPLAPAVVGERERAGGEDNPGLRGDDTGEVYDGGEPVSDGGRGGEATLSTCGGVAGLGVVTDVATAAVEGVVLSLS
jgi:hypothetical protein